MDKNQNDNRNQQNDGMSKDKTNQDFNKQKPNPNDPNQRNQNTETEVEDTKNKSKEITGAFSAPPANSKTGKQGNEVSTEGEENYDSQIEKKGSNPKQNENTTGKQDSNKGKM